MHALLNLNSQNVSPTFKSRSILNNIDGGFGLKKILQQDVVEIPKLRLRASQLYSCMRKKVANPTVEEITKIVDKLAKTYPREDVLATMYVLTQYSNMQSIYNLYDSIRSNGIESFRGFGSDNYYHLHRNESKVFKYKLPIGYLPSLSDIFSYFFDSNFGKAKLSHSDYRATILDKRTVQIMQEYKDKAPQKLSQLINKSDKFVYLSNFEGACNFLEGQQNLESKTGEILEKLTKLKNKNNGVSTQTLLNFILNKVNKDEIEKLEIPYTVIEAKTKRKPTIEDIVQNLSQKMPTEKEFVEILEKNIKPLTPDENFQLQYLNDVKDKLLIYTFRNISEKLRSLKGIIESEVLKQGKNTDAIYYFVPSYTKSYGLIASMYQKINNIPEDRFLDLDIKSICMKKDDALEDLGRILEDDATIVILDDASITGESLLFDLSYKAQNKLNLLYATIFSTPRAVRTLVAEKSPNLISVDSMSLDSQNKFVSKNSHFNGHSMLLFPYCAPDNNIAIFKELVEKFYPNKGFVQEPWFY